MSLLNQLQGRIVSIVSVPASVKRRLGTVDCRPGIKCRLGLNVTNNSCGHASLPKSQLRGKSHGSQERSTGNMSESEVENVDVLVNARHSLHYLRNYLYLFHENGLISIPIDYMCQESRSQSVYGVLK